MYSRTTKEHKKTEKSMQQEPMQQSKVGKENKGNGQERRKREAWKETSKTKRDRERMGEATRVVKCRQMSDRQERESSKACNKTENGSKEESRKVTRTEDTRKENRKNAMFR